MTFKIPIFLILCLVGFTVHGQTVINGKATDWSGKTIRLSQAADPISGKVTELSSDIIASDGSFELKCEIKEISTLWISVKRYKAPIFISPGADYQIIIVPKPENKLVDTWLKGSFEYGFEHLDSTDVNAVLGDFDNAYYNFYLDNAQLINSPLIRKKIHLFETKYASESPVEFINIYRNSSIGEMKLSAGIAPKSIYETYFFNKPVHPENSAWYSLFDLFYADYFQNFDSRFGGATIPNRIKLGMTPDSLSRLVDIDPFMANDNLKQWVLLKSIDQVYENAAYPKKFLMSTLHLIRDHAKTSEISQVANRMIDKIRHSVIGSSLEAIAVNWTPEYKVPDDKLPELLMISSGESTESLKEKMLLKSLVDKYGSIFRVSEVEIDAPKTTKSSEWPVYTPKNDLTFLDEFQIYSIPYFIWIDPNGKIAEAGIEKPSEGLESRLYKIKSEVEKSRKIKVGH